MCYLSPYKKQLLKPGLLDIRRCDMSAKPHWIHFRMEMVNVSMRQQPDQREDSAECHQWFFGLMSAP